MNTTVEETRRLVSICEYQQAAKLLEDALQSHPEDADLNAELALIYCHSQKEFEAAELLPKADGAERQMLAVDILRDYFYCRSLLAAKHGVADEKAAKCRKIVEKYGKGPAGKVGIKLSACLIVKNEEKHLERCLASVKPIVDEIVVVDTGSTDRTVEIAKKFGATIGHFEWCDDFSAARNESLRLATGDWALWIDADEELDPEGFHQIREGLIRPHFAGYYLQIVNKMDAEVEANTYVHTAVRLFRLIDEIRFTGRIHEQIINGFKERGYIPATLTKGRIFHYGYQDATMAEKNKVERTVTMLEREVKDCPEEPFNWFNLANAYSVAQRWPDAESAARRLADIIDRDAPYGPAGFQILTAALIALNQPAEALRYCEMAIAKGYDTVLNEFERAHALFELKRYPEALHAIERCMDLDWPVDLTGDYGIKTYKAHVLKGRILISLKRYDEAEELLNYALGKHSDFGLALLAKATLLENTGRFEEAFDHYMRASGTPGLGWCQKAAAALAKKHERPIDAIFMFQQYWYEHPEDLDAWLGWVQSCEAMSDWAGALQAYGQLGEENIGHPDLLINWGRALAASGDAEGALRKFGNAIERDPSNPNGYFNCGDTLYKLGYFHQAAHVYELGLRRDPHNAQAWFVLGNCFAQLNVVKGAVTSYEQALIHAPEHPEAKHNLEIVTAAADAEAA